LISVVTIPLILVFINKLRMDVAALLMAILLGGLQFFGLNIFGPAQSPKDAIQSISGFASWDGNLQISYPLAIFSSPIW